MALSPGLGLAFGGCAGSALAAGGGILLSLPYTLASELGDQRERRGNALSE